MKFTRQQMNKLIREINFTISLFSQKHEYVGSYRRKTKRMSDLDVLITCEDEQWVGLHKELLTMGEFITGDYRMKKYKINNILVDIQRVTSNIWGNALVYFTGPREENARLRKIAWGKGWLWLKRGNLFDFDMQEIKSEHYAMFTKEKDVYKFLKIPYVEPEKR